ncbi:hypothetical protein ACFOEE_11285 [Pseudoalteromonas fenneropenaei]|uniref:O-antigen ligase domain-containing protein n=1 Tax=Pseudoalteromonas fenneropenaei TaxID=1737459 RepID=A0ABV7CKN4_9GAMM
MADSLDLMKNNNPSILHSIVMLLLSFYLLADVVSGFAVLQLNIDLKISLAYKLFLTLILLFLIFVLNFSYILFFLVILSYYLLAPALQVLKGSDIAFFVSDFSNVVKILMPFIVFVYIGLMSERYYHFTSKWVERALFSNFIILCGNLVIGLMGFGRPSYELRDGESAGTNGFIYSANELGATMVVLFCFALHLCWNRKPKFYWLAAAGSLLAGVAVATKTALLATFLIIFLVPIFNERERFLSLTKLKFAMFAPALALTSVFVIMIVDFLNALGLYDKFVWVLDQKGVLGIILSGRDLYAKEILQVYFYQLELWQQVIGVSSAGIAQFIHIKYSAEIDSVDILAWFGVVGLFICLSLHLYLFIKAWVQFRSPSSLYSPCVALGLSILFCLSQLSGHVWMSGTLGVSLGLFASLLWFDKPQQEVV